MIGELLNCLFDELAGKDPATRRALGAPLVALSALFALKASGTLASASAAVMDGPQAAL